jgi:hypothetical protein
VEKNLAARLQSGVQAWTNALNGTKKEIDLSMDTDAPTQPTHKPGGDPQVSTQFPQNLRVQNTFADVNCVIYLFILLFL